MKYDNIFKIQLIKEKYKNDKLSDKVALQIFNLEQTRNKLKIIVPIIDAITIIDIFIPDPIFGLDEAALIAITAIINVLLNNTNKSIKSLLKKGKYAKPSPKDVVTVAKNVKKIKK